MTDRDAPTKISSLPTFAGSSRVFLAESLLIPTGLLTAAYLARRLGPEGYGVFTVIAAIIAWVEWSLSALFARASVKFVAEARNWQPIGSTIVRVHLVTSTGAAGLLALLARPIAELLGTPALTGPLQLFAVDIPLFCLAQAHRNILVGLGAYPERAVVAAARWLSRLLLIVVLVELGLSLRGAILGSIGASLIELGVARAFVRPAFLVRVTMRLGNLWGYAVPLLLSGVALRIFDRLDLVTLTASGAGTREAGFYAAAQSLALLPGLLAGSFSPVLLATLSRAFRDGEKLAAQGLGRDALRFTVLLVPFAGIVAGSASEIVALVFSQSFQPAAPLLPWLIFAATALVLLSISTAILTAAGHVGLTLALTGPLPLLALTGYLALIPGEGARGAAFSTFGAVVFMSLTSAIVVFRICHIDTPGGSLARSALLSILAYAAAALWATPGFLLGIKLLALSVGVVLVYGLLGEFSPNELRAARALLSRRPSTP